MADTAATPRPRRGHPDDARMSLVEHLVELRDRMVKSALALLVGVVVAWIFFSPTLRFLQHPYCSLPAKHRFPEPNGDCHLFVTGPLDQILLRTKVSMIAGALFSSPVWLYQLWAFVTPGLHPRERKWAVPFVGCSVALFAAGAAFAYFTLDKGLRFLLTIGGNGVTSIITVDKYLSFVTLMLVAFGVSFEFPLLLIFLNIIGVTPTARLRSWRRAMYFGLSVFAAVITPSQDPFTFLAMWVPLCVFYEVAIVFGRLRDRARRARGAADSTDQWDDDQTSPLSPADV